MPAHFSRRGSVVYASTRKRKEWYHQQRNVVSSYPRPRAALVKQSFLRRDLLTAHKPCPTADSAPVVPAPCCPVFSAASLVAAILSFRQVRLYFLSVRSSRVQRGTRPNFCGRRTIRHLRRHSRFGTPGRNPRGTRSRC